MQPLSRWFKYVIFALCAPLSAFCNPCGMEGKALSRDEVAYLDELATNWRLVLQDDGSTDWRDEWFLDGEHATVVNTQKGIKFYAGPTHLDNAHHAVLWTKKSFSGDVKIQYEYTKLDDTVWCATLLYIQATGQGNRPYTKDIAEWSDLRRKPEMPLYFEHMNLYHISYAAWGGHNVDRSAPGYIRARRYRAGPIQNTELQPDNYTTAGFFQKGVPHRITAIKLSNQLLFNVENLSTGKTILCRWDTTELPPILGGRIGLRQMFTRSACYQNFKVFVRDHNDTI